MRMRMAATALLAALALSACASDGVDPLPLTAPPSDVASASPAPAALPSARQFTIYTHCGVENALIDGRWWHVEEPLYRGAPGSGPPQGWANPSQPGMLTFTSADRAVFRAGPLRVELTPSVTDAPVRICR